MCYSKLIQGKKKEKKGWSWSVIDSNTLKTYVTGSFSACPHHLTRRQLLGKRHSALSYHMGGSSLSIGGIARLGYIFWKYQTGALSLLREAEVSSSAKAWVPWTEVEWEEWLLSSAHPFSLWPQEMGLEFCYGMIHSSVCLFSVLCPGTGLLGMGIPTMVILEAGFQTRCCQLSRGTLRS